MNDPRKVDIYSAEHKRDPFPFYAFLRSEAPVFEVDVPVLKRAWLITRYDDVVWCLQDSNMFVKNASNAGLRSPKSMPWWTPASLRTLSENMLDLDDPAHRRLRALRGVRQYLPGHGERRHQAKGCRDPLRAQEATPGRAAKSARAPS